MTMWFLRGDDKHFKLLDKTPALGSSGNHTFTREKCDLVCHLYEHGNAKHHYMEGEPFDFFH